MAHAWISNWELDLVVEDREFGQAMEQMYVKDLENVTEKLLTAKRSKSLKKARAK